MLHRSVVHFSAYATSNVRLSPCRSGRCIDGRRNAFSLCRCRDFRWITTDQQASRLQSECESPELPPTSKDTDKVVVSFHERLQREPPQADERVGGVALVH